MLVAAIMNVRLAAVSHCDVPVHLSLKPHLEKCRQGKLSILSLAGKQNDDMLHRAIPAICRLALKDVEKHFQLATWRHTPPLSTLSSQKLHVTAWWKNLIEAVLGLTQT